MIDRDRFPIDPWSLVENHFSLDDVGVTETLFSVGNGYLGLRGNQIEGRFAHEHGTFHQRLPRDVPDPACRAGVRFRGVGQTIINAPTRR
jgi:alpha,alpha-trehalose phosphorylase